MAYAPKTYNEKTLVYEEIFRSPFPHPTEESARQVLEDIRNSHSKVKGWLEVDSRIEQEREGFVAVRHHAQYK